MDIERKQNSESDLNAVGPSTLKSAMDTDKSKEEISQILTPQAHGSKDVPDVTFGHFKNLLTEQQYNNVMAIAHMINFHPESNEEHRTALLYSQNVTPSPKVPKNIVTFYHLLENRNVPKHLITNPMVRQGVERISTLPESGDSDATPDDDVDSSHNFSDSESEHDDEDDILRKAWIYYTKEQERKRKLRKNEKFHEKKKKNRKVKERKYSEGKGDQKKKKKVKVSTKDIDDMVNSRSGSEKDRKDWVHLF
jgi:hypothetical protein